LPDQESKTGTDLDLESQRYDVAAQEVIADSAPLVTSLGQGQADLSLALRHVSHAVQDFTSVAGTLGLGQAFASIQNTVGDTERDDQEQTAKRKRQRAGKDLDPRADTEQDLDQDQEQDEDNRAAAANLHIPDRRVNDQAADAGAGGVYRNAKNPESGQAEDEARAERADPSAILSQISKQQDRILQLSQNTTLNQVRAQALMAQLSARIEDLSVRQRQLQGNWRQLRMEGQNRTYQNMGGN
jgi:hypothetical protein